MTYDEFKERSDRFCAEHPDCGSCKWFLGNPYPDWGACGLKLALDAFEDAIIEEAEDD